MTYDEAFLFMKHGKSIRRLSWKPGYRMVWLKRREGFLIDECEATLDKNNNVVALGYREFENKPVNDFEIIN